MGKYKTITKEELQKMLDKKDVVIFDVRSYASYLDRHIKGAKSLPTNVIDEETKSLDKSKTIIVYCGGFTCPLSGFAAEKLSGLGFKVLAYEGGIAEWTEAGLPVE